MTEQPPTEWPAGTIFTLGHSTMPIDRFLDLLRHYGIRILVDIRTVPRSRHNPQFEATELARSCAGAGIGYRHLAALGGLRRTRADSPNTGWRNTSFRGYADYMRTDEFETALAELIALGRRDRTAIMCAEAVPWRCHRSLVADALTVRGIEVVEILSRTGFRRHTLTSFARADGTHLTYPPSEEG